MRLNTDFKSRAVPSYRLLTEEQIRHLHLATLELLETVGVQVMHPEAVAMLNDAGCQVEKDNVVKMPNELVENCIRTAPSCITVYNRLGHESMVLADRNTYIGMGTDLVKTWDLTSGELRASCLEDVRNSVKIADHLDEIDSIVFDHRPIYLNHLLGGQVGDGFRINWKFHTIPKMDF